MRNLRTQLLTSHFVLVALMVTLMAGSVASFRHLGHSIDRILHNNYKSVVAAQTMREELERQDGAAALVLAGQRTEARDRYAASESRFRGALAVVTSNVTEHGEQEVVDELGGRYEPYRRAIEQLILGSGLRGGSAGLYRRAVDPANRQLKKLAQNVLDLNHRAMIRADASARYEAETASRTGMALAGGACIFALIFALRMVQSSLSPLRDLASQAKEIGRGRMDQPIVVDRSDEIGTLGKSLNRMAELDRLKTEFIGVASHELRTPVTSLLLSAQLLQEGAAGPLTPEQREIVDAQLEDLLRLERLLRDLLDLTRLEAGVTPPRMEPVSPTEMGRSAVAAVAAQAEAKGVALREVLPERVPDIRADREQVTRALVNLLNNGIRHTPAGGEVSLSLFPDEEQLHFTVRDTGAGIPADYLPLIFERFVQVPGATGDGAGMGLCIAQTIAKAHGGEIRVVSELESGSAFTLSLPCNSR